jgi:hypothetical protein
MVAAIEADLMRATLASGKAQVAALDRAQRAYRRVIAAGNLYTAARPAAYRAAGTCAWLRGDVDEARRQWQLSLDEARALGSRFETARTLLETGLRLGDRASVKEAEALSRTCRAELVRRRSQELLDNLAS